MKEVGELNKKLDDNNLNEEMRKNFI